MQANNVIEWLRLAAGMEKDFDSLLTPVVSSVCLKWVPAGKPGNGSPKPDGSRLQVLYRAPKSC
jgi:hypothetical protein